MEFSFRALQLQSHPPMDSPFSSPPPPTLALPAPSPASEPSLRPTLGSKTQKSWPVPWSHQETLALIQAYQEKWYSLKKGQLKAFQWEEVACAVSTLCDFDEPSKTSTQCRHKIEKLRKRYKAELQKPYPDSWQYFELMDHMEHGPGPLNVRPVAVFKLSPGTSDRNTTNNVHPRYASVYSGPDHHHNNSIRNGELDESDDEWNSPGYGVDTSKRNNKSKSTNIVLGNVRSGVGSVKRDFNGQNDRFTRVLRNQMNGKRKQFYGEVDSEEDEEDDDLVEEKETLAEEVGDDDDDGGGRRELAAEIRGFVESFVRVQNKKIEMTRETERCRMDMEKKRMEMILGAQRKIIDTIGRAFGTKKKPRMAMKLDIH